MPHSELGASQIPRKARRKRFAYDVFLSHNTKDKPAVRELAERLKQDGLRVWFDEWVIQPGDSISLKIEQGLEQSRTLVLVMSHNAFASEWVTLERHTALFRDPTNAERRFIPLRLDDAEITDTLKQFAYIDWRQKTQEQYARLLGGVPSGVRRRQGLMSRQRPTRASGPKCSKDTMSWVNLCSNYTGRAAGGLGLLLTARCGYGTWRRASASQPSQGHADTVWGVAVTAGRAAGGLGLS